MTPLQIVLVYAAGLVASFITPLTVGPLILFFFAHINGDIPARAKEGGA